MSGGPFARLRRALATIAMPRRYATLAVALGIVLIGTAAMGARELRADSTSLGTTTSTATPSSSPLPASDAGPKNIVQVKNFTNSSLRVDGRVQLGRVPGPGIGAVNIADATSSCTDCQTLAVALQINLFNRNASIITPQNAAVAVNAACTRCDTIAYAVQYNIGVDDPTQVPPRVNQLVAQMKQELAAAGAQSATLAQAEASINSVIAQYQDLAGYLMTRRDEAVSPDASPSSAPAAPATSPSPNSAFPSASPDTTTPAAGASPSPSPTPSPTPTPTTTASAPPSRTST
jgi:hypothetical protein